MLVINFNLMTFAEVADDTITLHFEGGEHLVVDEEHGKQVLDCLEDIVKIKCTSNWYAIA